MMSLGKQRRLDAIANPQGIIAALAVDQRRSLRRMIAAAAGEPEEAITDGQLSQFKTTVSQILSPHASAILLDPEYGLEAAARRYESCRLLLTYEADGFDNPRPHRMVALLPRVSVRRLRRLGADAVKLLLSYTPEDDEAANDEKRAWVERVGNECQAQEMPFLLEPVVYDCGPRTAGRAEFARRMPELVVRTMEEFSKPAYSVDLLKVQFPVTAGAVGKVQSRQEALQWYRAADAAARCPYIYLSAGAEIDDFICSLELAAEAGVRFSGVLCGRAMWQGGVPAFAAGGRTALVNWLESDGVRNAQRIGECLRAATPWRRAAGAES